MSTHPNAILMAVLTPHGLSRKTMATILANSEVKHDDVVIGGTDYHKIIMESDYDEGWQVTAKEGDLVFFKLVTYGYGEVISWADLEAKKNALESWAKVICERHDCDYRIEVTANYW